MTIFGGLGIAPGKLGGILLVIVGIWFASKRLAGYVAIISGNLPSIYLQLRSNDAQGLHGFSTAPARLRGSRALSSKLPKYLDA
jgi:hypothetical protein